MPHHLVGFNKTHEGILSLYSICIPCVTIELSGENPEFHAPLSSCCCCCCFWRSFKALIFCEFRMECLRKSFSLALFDSSAARLANSASYFRIRRCSSGVAGAPGPPPEEPGKMSALLLCEAQVWSLRQFYLTTFQPMMKDTSQSLE